MRKSISYTVVFLILFSLCFISIPQVHSQTANVKVVTYSWYIDSAGLLDVVGEIQNVGTSIVSSVILSGTAITTTGSQQTSNTMAYVKNMLPNQKAPFYMTFFLQTDQATQSTPTVVKRNGRSKSQAATTTGYLYPDVKVTAHQNSIGTGTDDKGVYWVTGTVKNMGTQTATNVRVLGTFYDKEGNVIAVGGYTDAALSASLSPSASTNFKFGAYDTNQTLMPQNQQIASYALLVQVEGPILQGTAPQITSRAYPQFVSNGATSTASSTPTATSSSDDQTQIKIPPTARPQVGFTLQ